MNRTFLTLTLTALALLAPSACDDGSSGTSGRRITFRTELRGESGEGHSFVNSAGWTVTLDRALVSTGGFTYFDGAVVLSRGAPSKTRHHATWLGVSRAFAHPGHYLAGEARGEFLGSASADLLGVAVSLGETIGVSGFLRSATFRFKTPAEGAFAADLGEHVATLGGSAVRGAETRAFFANIDEREVLDPENRPSVEGCPFTEIDAQTDGLVSVVIDLRVWFDQVEFGVLPGGAAAEMPADSVARRELTRGMKVGRAYAFTYRPSL